MQRRFIFANGQPVPQHWGVIPDNTTNTFTVSVRSLDGIGPDAIKELLQSKFEVTKIEQTDSVSVVQGQPPVHNPELDVPAWLDPVAT